MKTVLFDMVDFVKREIWVFLIAIFSPIVTALFFVGILIFADTLLGVCASKKQHGWKSVTSRRLSDGVLPKLLIYPLILLIASACEQFFPVIPFIKSSILILISIEGKSFFENAQKILGIPVVKYVKVMITKGRQGLLEEIAKQPKEQENEQH